MKVDSPDQLDVNLFDVCCALNRVAPASLSMGMFWTRPDVWISVDKKNREFAATKGIEKKIQGGGDYLAWLQDVKSKFDFQSCEFSHEAHLRTLVNDDTDDGKDDDNDGPNYWLLAPGEKAYLWKDWHDRGFGAIGWNDVGDLSEVETEEDVAELVAEHYPTTGKKAAGRMLWDFSHVMDVDDIVFAKVGLFKTAGWGLVTAA
ncbi:MAG: hypothetical protein KDA61_12715, partial [Planctomycetales bacterium]|nr:hypothetical protein [Planctomycetales bacterium]